MVMRADRAVFQPAACPGNGRATTRIVKQRQTARIRAAHFEGQLLDGAKWHGRAEPPAIMRADQADFIGFGEGALRPRRRLADRRRRMMTSKRLSCSFSQ